MKSHHLTKLNRFNLCSAALVSLFLASPAHAEAAKIKSMSFDTKSAWTEMHVISTDGKKWNKLKNGNFQFWGHTKVDTKWPGWVSRVGVVLGQCGGNSCKAMPEIWSAHTSSRDWNDQRNFSFNAANIPLSDSDGIAPLPDGNEIINKCNQHLKADGPTKSYDFVHTFKTTFVVETGKAVLDSNMLHEAGDPTFPVRVDAWRHDSFDVKVICDPVIKPQAQDVAIDQGAFKSEEIKLFLATINGANTNSSNPGAKCPALKVTTRVQTSKAGGVDIKLWRQEGEGSITNEFKSAWASYDAVKNGYFADFVKIEKFDATTYLKFMAEVVGDAFAPTTQWKDITVHCTGAGGGGLTTNEPDHGDGPVIPPVKPDPQVDTGSDDLAPTQLPDSEGPKPSWAGDLTMGDSGGTRKACPRKGQVFFAVTRPEPGNFKYKIGCSNGQGFSGTAQSYSQGGPNFEAYGAHDLKITRTRGIQCTLQEVKDNGARVTIAKESLDFTCIKRAVDLDNDNVTVQPKPQPSKPPVSILCKQGFELVGKKCLRKPTIVVPCAESEVRTNGKCVKKPNVVIDCAKGFKLEGKKCVRKPVIVTPCKRGEIRINGACTKKPTVSIFCKPGFKLVGKTCKRQAVIGSMKVLNKPIKVIPPKPGRVLKLKKGG